MPPCADTVFRHLLGRPGLVWLSGGATHGDEGRWSFLGSDPDRIAQRPWEDTHPWRGLRSDIALERTGLQNQATFGAPPADRIPRWIGYIAYEGIGPRGWPVGHQAAEPAVVVHPATWWARYPALIAIDHLTGRVFAVGDDPTACAALCRGLDGKGHIAKAQAGEARVTSVASHRRAITLAKAAIAQGDIYQVNLARRWVARYAGMPAVLWTRMVARSPVPLGLYLDTGEHAVLACTMERFLRWQAASRRLHTAPIKGTVPRPTDKDQAHVRRLLEDTKERAEHTMIVDLMRNDLGRVAETGSVRVADRMRVEPYAKLAHLVSTVACTTRPELDWADILEATFPPGSVTGTPKRSAIEVIRELEPCPRGIYTGAVGYLDRGGGMSLAVAIRTAVIGGGQVQFHAGGGIVWDSDPAREVAETELKARAFLEALDDLAG